MLGSACLSSSFACLDPKFPQWLLNFALGKGQCSKGHTGVLGERFWWFLECSILGITAGSRPLSVWTGTAPEFSCPWLFGASSTQFVCLVAELKLRHPRDECLEMFYPLQKHIWGRNWEEGDAQEEVLHNRRRLQGDVFVALKGTCKKEGDRLLRWQGVMGFSFKTKVGTV